MTCGEAARYCEEMAVKAFAIVGGEGSEDAASLRGVPLLLLFSAVVLDPVDGKPRRAPSRAQKGTLSTRKLLPLVVTNSLPTVTPARALSLAAATYARPGPRT